MLLVELSHHETITSFAMHINIVHYFIYAPLQPIKCAFLACFLFGDIVNTFLCKGIDLMKILISYEGIKWVRKSVDFLFT